MAMPTVKNFITTRSPYFASPAVVRTSAINLSISRKKHVSKIILHSILLATLYMEIPTRIYTFHLARYLEIPTRMYQDYIQFKDINATSKSIVPKIPIYLEEEMSNLK